MTTGNNQTLSFRERNRVLAKKTRQRKKFFFESLQRQVVQLSSENEMLKTIVKERLATDVKNQVLSQCKTEIPPVVATNYLNPTNSTTSMLEQADYRLISAISAAQRSFVITDPSLPDNPIIFASQGFLELSGYRVEEVLGRNCRFMQGPGTDLTQVDALRKGIMAGEDTAVCLLNYKRNGKAFYNQIFVASLRDSTGRIINQVGVQVEVSNKPKLSSIFYSLFVYNRLKIMILFVMVKIFLFEAINQLEPKVLFNHFLRRQPVQQKYHKHIHIQMQLTR